MTTETIDALNALLARIEQREIPPFFSEKPREVDYARGWNDCLGVVRGEIERAKRLPFGEWVLKQKKIGRLFHPDEVWKAYKEGLDE